MHADEDQHTEESLEFSTHDREKGNKTEIRLQVVVSSCYHAMPN